MLEDVGQLAALGNGKLRVALVAVMPGTKATRKDATPGPGNAVFLAGVPPDSLPPIIGAYAYNASRGQGKAWGQLVTAPFDAGTIAKHFDKEASDKAKARNSRKLAGAPENEPAMTPSAAPSSSDPLCARRGQEAEQQPQATAGGSPIAMDTPACTGRVALTAVRNDRNTSLLRVFDGAALDDSQHSSPITAAGQVGAPSRIS
jgi:hypothetical protein